MKNFVAATVAGFTVMGAIGAIGVIATLVATDADARPYHHRGARVGVYIGAPIIAAPFYRPYYYNHYAYPYYAPSYYPPAPIIVREQPVVYVEQPVTTAPVQPLQQVPPAASAPQAQAQQQYWYFCQESQTYYPHVQTCASPWQRVTPHAPQ
jgi:hypothetical protein